MMLHGRLKGFGAAILLLLLLLPASIVMGSEKTSAWVQIDGQAKQSNLRSGNVLGTVDVVDGECDSAPDFSMGLSSDVKSFRVGVDTDVADGAETCDIVVKNMVFNEDHTEGPGSMAGSIAPSASYQEWWVEALAKVVGLNSIDDLTKTRTSFEFTRTPTSVFGGHDGDTDCWGNHYPSPPFFYYVDDCYVNSFDFDGPTSVHIRLKGEYEWQIIPGTGGVFDHQTTAKAEGTVTHDRAVCTVVDLPLGSSLECELDSGEPD